MLKSCVKPCEVLIGGRHSLVTKSFTFDHFIALSQRQHQLRHDSSSSRSRSRWGDKQRAPKATNPPSSSKPKSAESETLKTLSQQFKNVESSRQPPAPSFQFPKAKERIDISYRPLIIDPVKPTPNQDLSSTRPAELEKVLPPEQDEEGNVSVSSRASYFYRLGKSYLTFYKTGLKNIWNNRKEYHKIKARLGACHPDYAALYGGQLWNKDSPERIPKITRREYQLYLRTKYDLGKLIPFGIVFAICGEFTPIVILALGSSVVPYTCRIPKQVQHDRRWFMKRLQRLDLLKKESADCANALELAFLHGVSPVAKLPPVVGPILFHFWVQPRLIRRGFEILADTALIRREGGFSVLEPIEIYEYANRFFCPQLIWASKLQLETSGEINWKPQMASTLGSILEQHATIMLTEDWKHIPERVRFQAGLIYDGYALSSLQEKGKQYKSTGKMPD